MAGKSDTIKNKIVLEGEGQYRKQLSQINREIKESKAAMRAAAAEYGAAEGSMLALYQQGDALERTLRSQNDALALMEEQLGKVEGAYGKNSREAVELRTRINNMRAEISKTKGELREFERGLEESERAMDNAGDAGKQAEKGLAQIGDGAKEAEDEVESLIDTLGNITGVNIGGLVGGGAAAAAIGSGISSALKIGGDTLESWNQLSAYTGATGEELEQIKTDAMAVYQTGVGESLGDVSEATGAIYQMTGYTGASLQDCVLYALALRDTFNMDVSESARSASVLMGEFGISGKDAYDLIATGAQKGADKNGNLLDTVNEYSPYFAASGKSAEEFFSALINGAQNGVYDVDKIGDAWKEFTLRIQSDETAKEALGEMGFAAEDVVRKIAAGGPAADLATQMIVQALADTEDDYERNRLGIALFATQWEDTKGKVLPAFVSMKDGLGNVTGAAQNLADVKYDDLDTAWAGLTRRLEIMASPMLLEGVNMLIGAIDNVQAAWTEFENGNVDAGMEKLFGVDDLKAQAAAAQGASGDLREELYALEEAIANAFAEGDGMKAWSLQAQKDALLAEIATIEAEAMAAMQTAGEETAGALEETKSDMESAAQDVAESAVTEIEDVKTDMNTAGETIGESAVTGAETGLNGMEAAGRDGASGLVTGLNSGLGAAYSAGAALGGAFSRGYKNKMMINSPSRVMIEAGHYTTAGLFEAFDEDAQELRERAAGLAEAVGEGYSSHGALAPVYGAVSANEGIDYGAIGEAVARAISSMTLGMDARKAGSMLEMYVSQAERTRAGNTAAGGNVRAINW